MAERAAEGARRLNKFKGFNPNREKIDEILARARMRMEAKGLKETTITNVLGCFRQFLELVGPREAYDADDLRRFLAYKRRMGCSGTTIHNYYRFLKIIWDRMGWPWPLTPEDLPKKEAPYQPYFTIDETRRLEEAAERIVGFQGRYGELLRLRNRILIRLSAVTMLRRIEIMRLNLEDYQRPFILVRNPAKRSEYTQRILDPKTCNLLDEYLKLRRRLRVKCPALFITGRGHKARRLSLKGLSDIIKRIREEAGIDKPRAGWHAHRRGGITIAHREGVSEKLLSKYTGITPEIVKRYIRLDHSDAIEAFSKAHPFFKETEEE